MISEDRLILNAIRERRKKGTVDTPVTMTGFPVLNVPKYTEFPRDHFASLEEGQTGQTIEDWDRAYLLDLVDFLQCLIHDLKQEGTSYDRGKEDGAKEERSRCVTIIANLDASMRERSLQLTGNYLEVCRFLISEIHRTQNTVVAEGETNG